MGVSSKSSSSTASTSNTGTSTSTPTVPQWGVDSLKGLNDMIEKLAGSDPSSFVAGPSDLQSKAFTGASNLGGWQDGYGDASGILKGVAGAGPSTAQFTSTGPAALATAGHATAAGIFDNGISQYLNPETEHVVDSALSDFDNSAGQVRARQAAQGAGSGAFGGSRWGLQEGETEGQLSRARAATDATLRQTAFDRATGLAGDDANRRQQVSITNAGLDTGVSEANAGAINRAGEFNATGQNQNSQFNAGARDADLTRQTGIAGLLASLAGQVHTGQLADITTQAGLGDTQRGIDQAKATAPVSLAQTIAQLLGQNQLPLLTGTTTDSTSTGTSTGKTTETPSTWSQIGSGIQTAANLAALFSDRRLKRDVTRLGSLPSGLGVYLYRYLWSPLTHVGVMAQEVLKVKPEAVITDRSGFLMVDYGALG